MKIKIYYMKFISSTGGAENFFANVSIGDAQGMYYLSSSGLECKVKNKHTIDAKNYVTSESYVNAKIITNWKRNQNFNNFATLLSENSTNSLKVKRRTKQSSKILIDLLYISFLDIQILKAVNHKPDQVNGTLWNSKTMCFRSDYE